MKFVCERCQTKYSIADEKVRGKILKVRCKSCTNIITVREEGTGTAASPARRPSAPASPVGSPAASPSARPLTPSTARASLAPPAPPPVERRAAPRPPEPADDGVAWYMALDGNRIGPFSRKQLLEKIAPLPRDADLHVCNETVGRWNPRVEIPTLGGEVAARRRPPTPVSSAPPPPPPFPGTPRRPTAPAMAAAPAALRQSGAHAVVGAAIGPGVGLKLPPPVAPPGGRRPPGPVVRPAGLAAAGLAPAASHEAGLDIDPSTMLETPAPQPHMLHGLGTNGVGHADGAVSNGTATAADKSDVLNTLNLASASGAGPAPRLLSSEAVVGWQPSAAETPAARQRTGRRILALLAVIAAACVFLILNATKKPKPPVALPSKAIADPLAGVVDNPPPPTAPGPAETPPSVGATPEAAAEPSSSGHGHGKGHPAPHGRNVGATSPTTPPPLGASGTAATPSAPVVDNTNARYRDTGRNLNISGGSGGSRPAPSQSDITRVINNNRGGIKNCYQRALLRDNSLTHGKITVQVNIGISGRVKRTTIDGPPQFRALDPCIKEVVGRWAFPQAGDEYGTEFVYVFQGNE